MKAILSAILAVAIAGSPLLANQDPQTEKEKQRKEEEARKRSTQTPAQEPQPEEKPKPKPEKPKQEPAPPPAQQPKQEEKQQQKEQEKQQKEQAKQNRQKPEAAQPNTGRSSTQGSGGHARGQKIPEQKYQAKFGHEHHFRVAQSAADSRRFQYGGYWFEVVEVWPAGWSFDDECYIEEDGDDYYVVDYIHPELRVLVIVVEG